MRELWAIFADDPGAPNFTAIHIADYMRVGQSPDAAFDEAAKHHQLLGRRLRGMWTVDPDSDRSAAIKAFGVIAVPWSRETIWHR
jgi:hypothetical protein